MSQVVVLKFGGTSIATPGRVRLAARRVRAHRQRGRRVVVVVSAAGSTTDRILERVDRVGLSGVEPLAPPPLDAAAATAREVDRALATGEDRSAALLAVALWRIGVPARSLRGGEAGLRAEGAFGRGRLARVDPDRLFRLLDGGLVPVVSGFQAERVDGETVTLGRGGSDTSGVAIAAALNAPCHIVTDVQAVHDRDPNVHADARPLAVLDHTTLLALVERGAEVVHPTAARLAAESRVPLRIYHFRAPLAGTGTRVGGERLASPAPVPAGGAA